MKKVLSRMACITIAMLLIATTASYAAAEVSSGPRIYHGPNQVYDERSADLASSVRVPKPGKPPVGPQPDPSVNKWAVVIGISDYRGIANDLQYCDDDARDMYNYLISKGYPAGNIKLLLDGDAKAKAIISAIDWLNSWEGPNSEVVFFYSGHGSTYKDGRYNDGDTELDGKDEAIVSADLYLILDGQLRQRFFTFSSQKISFTFDSCFSGGMDDLQGNGRVVVAACGEDQYSYDGTADQQNGVFTYYYVGTDTAGLQTYNTVEGAFAYAAPLAHDFVAQMDPIMYDMYAGDWTF